MQNAFRFLAFSAFLCFLSAAAFLSAAEREIVTFDLEYANHMKRADPAAVRRGWDETFLTAALQGLVNRKAPRLYIFYVSQGGQNVDRYWFDLFSRPLPDGTPGWLEGRPVRQAESLEELLVFVAMFLHSYEPVASLTRVKNDGVQSLHPYFLSTILGTF